MMQFDAGQRRVIEWHGGRAMALAGPGCGKTGVLAERVAYAREHYGVEYADMLCLTFTNRAARSMRDRVAARLGELPDGLYVGNLHRFCINFLHTNGLVSPDTAILDEDDAADFIDRRARMAIASWRNEVQAVAVDMYMDEHGYPRQLRRALWFAPHEGHRSCAREYERFKRDNNMMDFDDCLLWTYDALRRGADGLQRSRFGWVQVDEVQDLTPLQMAIVGQLAPAPDATVLYLGDEQQAIFDFLGAGADVLARVKDICGGRVFRLHRNYRSASYIVELCNSFAVGALGVDPALLPDVGTDGERDDMSLTRWHVRKNELVGYVASLARRFVEEHPDETTAILVRTNAELARVHAALDACGTEHIAVGARDAFKLVAFKTVYAHMAVALNPLRTAEWARLLYQLGCVRRIDDSAALLGEMRDAAMTPADLLSADGITAVERAVVAMELGGTLAPQEVLHLGRLLFPARRSDVLADFAGLLGDGPMPEADLAVRLMCYMEPLLHAALARQEELMERRGLDAMRQRLDARYGALYRHTQDMLASDEVCAENTLEAELDYAYRALLMQGRIDAIPRWEAMRALLGSVVTDSTAEPRLREQLKAHLHELLSFNEGDIYDKGLGGRLSVMTVHKAKGLEMDNVIVFNANTFWGSHLDRARILYVAFSRARKRLAVYHTDYDVPVLDSVADYFLSMPELPF